jgi:hypothetical protein
MEESSDKISKFSSGVNIIIRLDGLWKDVNNHARANFYEKWNQDLDRIWCELARDLKEEDYSDKIEKSTGKVISEGYKSKFDSFDTEIAGIGTNFNDNYSDNNGFQPVPKEVIEKRNEHYKILMEKELFLRRLENKLGKGTTWNDDDEDGFD